MCSNKVGFKIVKARAINQGVEGVKTITGRAPWEPTHAGSGHQERGKYRTKKNYFEGMKRYFSTCIFKACIKPKLETLETLKPSQQNILIRRDKILVS